MFHNVHLIVCLPMYVLKIVSRFSLCFKEHPCAMVSISLECHKVGLLGHRVCALFIFNIYYPTDFPKGHANCTSISSVEMLSCLKDAFMPTFSVCRLELVIPESF